MKTRNLQRWFMIAACLSGILLSGAILWLTWDLPDIRQLEANLVQPSVRINDRNGVMLYEIMEQNGGRHTAVSLAQIPEYLKQATIATEDRKFYSNPGVDLEGISRAIWNNLQGGNAVIGGSTITQQVSRNLLLGSQERGQRSIRRKLREMLLAIQLTRNLSKDQILELYLNQTYYGGMAYGVEAAAQTFFAKPVSELDLAESALLAGLPQAPALYNPFTDLGAAKERQAVVLRLMEGSGFIKQEEGELAFRESLVLAEKPYPMEAPHFVMMVKNELDRLFNSDAIYASGGLVVRTSVDLNWQHIAEQAIDRHLIAMQQSEDGFGHNMNNAALVAIDPHSGDVLALVGSPDYYDTQHGGAINMAIAPRQPGSALKPLVYAVALDPAMTGAPWTAATMLLDVKTAFVTRDGEAYIPENYDLKEHGPVLLREALASSLNIPAVTALDHIGVEELFTELRNLGVTTLKDPHTYDLSLALGGGEVRLIELTAAYGAFASFGYRVEPRLVLDVADPEGKILYAAVEMPAIRVLDERVAWLISDILSDNDARRIGFGLNSVLKLDRPAAVKTGTTSNFHDNWTIGYTPDLVVGVWAGNTTYESMRGVNGLSGAAPIWHQFMRSVLKGTPESQFDQPPGLQRVEVCALSGLIPTDFCAFKKWEWFIEGTQPTRADSFYRRVFLDQASGRLADSGTPPMRRVPRIVLDLPPEAIPWAREQKLVVLADLIDSVDKATGITDQGLAIDLVSPAGGSKFQLSDSVPAEHQKIMLEAVAARNIRSVTFFVDGEKLATLDSQPFQVWWMLTPGDHRAWVEALTVDQQVIQSAVISFSVN